MFAAPQIVDAAKRNGKDNIHGQFTGGTNNRIRAHRVVDLLVSATSPAAQRGARELLNQMSMHSWAVTANVHSNDDDPTPHINVTVHKAQYHLRLDARGCVFDITMKDTAQETIRLSGHEPHKRPGA